jgi:Holliday junction resolvase RusA-like endonuclease
MTATWYQISGINPEPWTPALIPRRGQPVKGGKLEAYQAAIKEELPLQNAHFIQHEGDLSCWFFVYRSSAHGKQADATNIQKATEDALQGVLFGNDRYNRDVRCVIMEQSPTTNPHLYIRIGDFDRQDFHWLPSRQLIEQTQLKYSGFDYVPPSEELF